MREFNIFGIKFTVGDHPVPADFSTQVKEAVDQHIKGFTYDKLFTTGQMLDAMNTTRVSSPYETLATVYKAVSVICDNVVQAKFVLYRHATKEKVDDKPLQDLLDHPNPRQNRNAFVAEWAGFRALYGEAFIRKIASVGQKAGTSKLPAQLVLLDPAKITEVKDANNDELIGWKYSSEFIPADQVIHSKSFNPYNRNRGISPLKPITVEMQIDKATMDFNLAFFRNDGSAGLFLVTDKVLNQEQRNRITEDWAKKHAGAKNSFKPEILEGGLKPMPSTLTHKDMDFVSQKDLARKEILGTWRVPESLFNITKDVNYATLQGQIRIFWIYTLIPMMNQFAEDVDAHLVDLYDDRYDLGIDLTNVPAFQDELYTKVDSIEKLSKAGFTGNEINKMLELGFEEKPWRDEWWVNFGMVTATQAQETPRIQQTINDNTQPEAITPVDPAQPKSIEDRAKVVKAKRSAIKQALMKMHAVTEAMLEKKFESKMSRFFNELRVEALKTPAVYLLAHQDTLINWKEQEAKLAKMIKPLIAECANQGMTVGQNLLDHGKGISKDKNDNADAGVGAGAVGASNLTNQIVQHRVSALIEIQANKMSGRVIYTIQNQIKDRLKQATIDGASQSMNRDALFAIMTEDMKGVFKNAITRASLIARTEVGGAMNGASFELYKMMGIKYKSWGTAHDDLVRETHIACEEMGVIPMDQDFENGLAYPCDQDTGDASEVCNCRCKLIPELGD